MPCISGEWADDYSGFGNEILYDMCRREPRHDDLDVVCDKLWLIGRSHAASAERNRVKDYHLERTAWLIAESDIDARLAEAREIERPTLDNLPLILDTHRMLTGIFEHPGEAGGTGQRKRSLASKYLHFHAPRAFFIYDSISLASVERVLSSNGRAKYVEPDSLRDHGDPEYRRYAVRLIQYRDEILETELGKLASPRCIDNQLQEYTWRRAWYQHRFANRAAGTAPPHIRASDLTRVGAVRINRPWSG